MQALFGEKSISFCFDVATTGTTGLKSVLKIKVFTLVRKVTRGGGRIASPKSHDQKIVKMYPRGLKIDCNGIVLYSFDPLVSKRNF